MWYLSLVNKNAIKKISGTEQVMLLKQELITIPNNLCKSLNLSGPNISPPQNIDNVYYPHKNHYDDEKYYLNPIPLSSQGNISL